MANLKSISNKRLMTDYLTHANGGTDENATPVSHKAKPKKLNGKGDDTPVSRPSLKEIEKNTLNQHRHEKEKDKSIKPKKGPISIYEDAPSSGVKSEPAVETGTQTEEGCYCSCHEEEEKQAQKKAEEEALELMCSETVPEGYWKAIAEERRDALNDSLSENQELHEKVLEQEEKIEKLKALADQAEYFASILREATEASDDEDEKDDKAVSEVEPKDETPEEAQPECSSQPPEEQVQPLTSS